MKRFGADAECVLRTTSTQNIDTLRDHIARLDNKIKDLESRDFRTGPSSPGQDVTRNHFTPQSAVTNDTAPRVQQYQSVEGPDGPWRRSHSDWSTNARPLHISETDPNASSNRYISNERQWRGEPSGRRASSVAIAIDTTPCDDAEDGEVNAMMGATADASQTQAFFGPSSAGSFTRQIRSAMDAKAQSPATHPSRRSLLETKSMPSAHDQQQWNSVHDPILPPKDICDKLFAIYWRIVYPLYPFVEKLDANRVYQELWSYRRGPHLKSYFICQINVIFAISCKLDESIDPAQRAASAEMFISRVKDTSYYNIWEDATVHSIQIFLLLAQYLQSTNLVHQCWIVVGQAIRCAQSLGLHMKETTDKLSSPRERQLARKIWHGCVLMDRVVSMTYGRPAMIDQAAAAKVPMPLALDDEYFIDSPEKQPTRPSNTPMLSDFFIKTLDLYEILNKILVTLYGCDELFPSHECRDDKTGTLNKASGYGILLELDLLLNTWLKSLPTHLDSKRREIEDDVFQRQANILHSRYLHVRILLFRPALARFAAVSDVSSPDSLFNNATLARHLEFRCSIFCIESAKDAIDTIHNRLPESPAMTGPLPAWWYNILYVYTAATILIAALLCPSIASEIPKDSIMRSWRSAMTILDQYRLFSSSASRSIAALELLFHRVPLHKTQGPTERHQTPAATEYGSSSNVSDSATRNEEAAQSLQQRPDYRSYVGAAGSVVTEGARYSDYPQQPQQESMAEGSSMLDSGMDVDGFNMSFNMNDLSWLNALPNNFQWGGQ
ncbi:hypothetical protein AAFC00_006556 [Neodothiora populina]